VPAAKALALTILTMTFRLSLGSDGRLAPGATDSCHREAGPRRKGTFTRLEGRIGLRVFTWKVLSGHLECVFLPGAVHRSGVRGS
jgi:hypothetical protein